eukprot:PhM_4_TR1071/c0_g1_i1/m.26886
MFGAVSTAVAALRAVRQPLPRTHRRLEGGALPTGSTRAACGPRQDRVVRGHPRDAARVHEVLEDAGVAALRVPTAAVRRLLLAVLVLESIFCLRNELCRQHLAAEHLQSLGLRGVASTAVGPKPTPRLAVQHVVVLGAEGKEVRELLVREEPLVLLVAQDALHGTQFVDLSLVDLLFNCADAQQTVHKDVVALPKAPHPLSGLHVRDRVPVWVEDDYARRADEVDADAADAGRHERDEDAGVVVEGVDEGEAVCDGRAPVEPDVLGAVVLDGGLNDVEHRPRLREHDCLAPLRLPRVQQRQEDLQLAGALVRRRDVVLGDVEVRWAHKPWVVADFTHHGQRLEEQLAASVGAHHHGLARERVLVVAVHDAVRHVLGHEVRRVHVDLLLRELAEQDLLRLRGEHHADVGLHATQQERRDECLERAAVLVRVLHLLGCCAAVRARLDGLVEGLDEGLVRAQELRVYEVEQGPQLDQPVLDGRARHEDAVRRRDGLAGDGRRGLGVADKVALIEHDVVDLRRQEVVQRVPYHGVRGDDDAVLETHIAQERRGRAAVCARGVQHVDAQHGGPEVQLAHPLRQDRRGADNDRGAFAETRVVQGTEEDRHLHGLAETHLVRKDTADAEAVQLPQPLHAHALVVEELVPDRHGNRKPAVEAHVVGLVLGVVRPGLEHRRDLRHRHPVLGLVLDGSAEGSQELPLHVGAAVLCRRCREDVRRRALLAARRQVVVIVDVYGGDLPLHAFPLDPIVVPLLLCCLLLLAQALAAPVAPMLLLHALDLRVHRRQPRHVPLIVAVVVVGLETADRTCHAGPHLGALHEPRHGRAPRQLWVRCGRSRARRLERRRRRGRR